MKTRPEISDQEIQSMMDFNKVLDVHRHAQKRSKLFWSAGIASGIIILLIGFELLKPSTTSTPQQKIIQDSAATVVEKTIEPVTEPAAEPVAAAPEKNDVVKKEAPKQEPVVETTQTYTEAEPLNGYPDLYAYFQKELKYPVEALKDSIEGIVSVSFVINKEGKPEQVKILNSLGTAFDNEATRVITGMPGWKPAAMNGKAVPARISMPLTFQIEKQ